MEQPADYHMHTPLCRHARGRPLEYAAAAVQRGLAEIGFSDHSPMRRDDFDDWRMHLDQLDEYVESVEEARRTHPSLRIRLALEVDYLPGHEDWIRELAGRHAWDYFIGSVHYVSDSWDLDNPAKLSQWSTRPVTEVWLAYLERLTQAAASGLFQIIGHADLPKKFRHYPDRDLTPEFDRFLEAARSTGTAIELNTAGLRKDCREIYPSPAFLARAQAIGVAITFGSDAHAPEEVGADFDAALALARRVGYHDWVQFEDRRPRSRPLPPSF
jgi:histidinol-phosphatase (PHP family)